MISRVLRAVSCYVDKVIRKWIAVFSSGLAKLLLYVKSLLRYRELYPPNWQIPFKLRYWKGVETQQDSLSLSLDFFATASAAALSSNTRFFFIPWSANDYRLCTNLSSHFFSPPELPFVSSAGGRVTACSSRSFCFSPSCLVAPEKTSHWDEVLEWYFFEHFGFKFQSSCRLRGKIQFLDVGEIGAQVQFWNSSSSSSSSSFYSRNFIIKMLFLKVVTKTTLTKI